MTASAHHAPDAAPDDGEPLPPALVAAQDELAGVCESIAEFWGFTRTQGRIFGLLLLSPEPLDHKAIHTRLDISAGSASMTLAALVDWGVLHREGRKYRAETDLWTLITHVLQRREREKVDAAIARVERALAALRDAHTSDPRVAFARDRLTYLLDFFSLGRSLLTALLSRGPVSGILASLARRAARARAHVTSR